MKKFLIMFITVVLCMSSISVFAQGNNKPSMAADGQLLIPDSKAYLGDVNRDGAVTVRDAMAVLRAVVTDTENTSEFDFFSDVNENGELAVDDALQILKTIAGSKALKETKKIDFEFVENISMDREYASDNIRLTSYEQLAEYLSTPEGGAWTKLSQLTPDFFAENDLWITKEDGYISEYLSAFAKSVYSCGDRLYYSAVWNIPVINTGHGECLCVSAVKIPKQDHISLVMTDAVLDYAFKLTQFEYPTSRLSISHYNEKKWLLHPTIIRSDLELQRYLFNLDTILPEKDGSKTYGGLAEITDDTFSDHALLCFELYYPFGNEWFEAELGADGDAPGVSWYTLKHHKNTLPDISESSYNARVIVLEMEQGMLLNPDFLIYLDKDLL